MSIKVGLVSFDMILDSLLYKSIVEGHQSQPSKVVLKNMEDNF